MNSEAPLLGLQQETHMSISPSSSHEGDAEVSASTTTDPLDTSSAVSSTTFASSSLSTLFQTSTTLRVELGVSKEETTASHFSFSRPATSHLSPVSSPPRRLSWELPLARHMQEALPSKVASSSVSTPAPETSTQSVPVPTVASAPEKLLPVMNGTELPEAERSTHTAAATQSRPVPSTEAEVFGVTVAPSLSDQESKKTNAKNDSQKDGPLVGNEGTVDGHSEEGIAALTAAVNKDVDPTVPPLTAVPALSPSQGPSPEKVPRPPLAPVSLSQVGEALTPTLPPHTSEQSLREDIDELHRGDHLAREHGSSNSHHTNSSRNRTSTDASLSPRDGETSLISTKEVKDYGDQLMNSERPQGGQDGVKAVSDAVKETSTTKGGKEEEEGVEGNNSGTTNGDDDGDDGDSTTQVPLDTVITNTKTPFLPTGAPRRPSNSGPRLPAVALLVAESEETTKDRRDTHTKSGDSGGDKQVAPSPTSSASTHFRRLQISTTAPSLIVVDAPVTTHMLEIASTRSSLPSSSAPSEVLAEMLPMKEVKGGGGSRVQKEKASAARPSPLSPTQPKSPIRHKCWSTPLFPSGNDEEAEAKEHEEDSGMPASELQPLPSVTSLHEEEQQVVVGETTIIPVVPRAPASTSALLTSTEKTAPVPQETEKDAARTSTLASLTAPRTPAPSYSFPAALAPLSATEEGPAVVSEETPTASQPPSKPPSKSSAAPPATVLSLAPQKPISVSVSVSSVESGERQQQTAAPLVLSVDEEVSPMSVPVVPTTTTSLQAVKLSSPQPSAPPSPPQRLAAKGAIPLSPPAAVLSSSSHTPRSTSMYERFTTANADNATVAGTVSAASTPPRLSPVGSVDNLSIAAPNSWTLESAGQKTPRLSMSGFPMNSIYGGLTSLTMARFANRGTVSAESSNHGDDNWDHHGGQRDRHDVSASSSLSYSYSYSYSYTGGYSDASVANPTDSPRTPAATPGDVRDTASYLSTRYQRELSATRVGSTDGLHSTAVELTAYEEVTMESAKTATSAKKKFSFLQCLCKKLRKEAQRPWRTGDYLAHGAASRLTPAQCSQGVDARATAAADDNNNSGGGEGTAASTTSARTQGGHRPHVAHTDSTVDPVSATASAAVDGDEDTSVADGAQEVDRDGDQPAAKEEATRDQRGNADESVDTGASTAAKDTEVPSTFIALQLHDTKDEVAGDAAAVVPLEQKSSTPSQPVTADAAKPNTAASNAQHHNNSDATDEAENLKTNADGNTDRNQEEHQKAKYEEENAASLPSTSDNESDAVPTGAVISGNANVSGAGWSGADVPPDLVAHVAVTEQLDVKEEQENRIPLVNIAQCAEDEGDGDGDAQQLSPLLTVRTASSSTLSIKKEEEGPPLEPLKAFYVYTEEAPRFYAWDAEPPTTKSDAEKAQQEKEVKWEERLRREAAMAADAAQAALQQALFDMAVHPPRQCLFVEVHGLRQLSRAVLCPRHAKSVAAAPNAIVDGVPTTGMVAATADEWRRDGWSAITNRGNVPINSVVAVDEKVEEDPLWTEVRLAVYSSDRRRLVAAGSTFKLPANAAALQRSQGVFQNRHIQNMETLGRDSWSDVLVYQQDEVAYEDIDRKQPQKNDASAPNSMNDDRNSTTTWRSDDSVNAAPNAFSMAALYVQLEERQERWVPVKAEEAEVPSTGASLPASGAPKTQAGKGQKEEETEEAQALFVESDSTESIEWKTNSETDTESSLTSDSSFTGRHTRPVRDEKHSKNATSATENTKSGNATAIEEAQDDGEAPKQQPLRLEEYWSFLAISPLLSMEELQKATTDGLARSVYMTVASVGQTEETLPCRVCWAVEPPPPTPPSESSHDTQQQKQSSSDSNVSSAWASLGAAIAQYERVRRGRGDMALCNGYCDKPGDDEQDNNQHRPLTVLWNTICTPAAALQCQEADGETQNNAAQQPRWRSGLIDAHTSRASLAAKMQWRPSVCSVVVRCFTAVLLSQPSSLSRPAAQDNAYHLGLSSTYCVPTMLTVTGGLDGFVGRTAVTRTAMGSAAVESRTPVMRYDLNFHAVLTRKEASSLLFTVQSAGTPEHVFGFADFNPFEREEQERHALSRSAGGVMDLWLPMFAPAEAPADGANEPVAAELEKGSRPVMTGGMILAGWLHCDVEVVYFSSLSESAVQQLWNGAQRSLTALELAAVSDESCNTYDYDGDVAMMDGVVDVCVVEAAGLRPLTTRFGAPLPPAPLLWDVVGSDGGTTACEGCAHVYCEMVALQRDTTQQHGRLPESNGGGVDVAAAAAASVPLYNSNNQNSRGLGGSSAHDLISSQARSAVDVSSHSRGSAALGNTPVSGRGGCAAFTTLPVTTAVAHTHHPRWQHTFRCGLATLSGLCLRVFDRVEARKHQNGMTENGDGSGGVVAHARTSSTSRSLLLGTATVSPWMLRRCIVNANNKGGFHDEGGVWLPLLWTPTMSLAATAKHRSGGSDGGRLQEAFFPAVSNGYVLVRWWKAPTNPSPRHGAIGGYGSPVFENALCVCTTRRCLPQKMSAPSLPKAARRRKASSVASNVHLLATCRSGAVRFPSEWYQGIHSLGPSQKLTWMSPELVPWLWVRHLRLRWPWVQHILALYGGHVRLNVLYIASANVEQRMVDQFLLMPLCHLQGNGENHRESGSTALGRARMRRPHVHSSATGGEENGVFCIVSAASFSLSTLRHTAASIPPPLESTFCFPASRDVAFELWWYPNTMPYAMGGNSASCPPRLLGRGGWHFPLSEVDAYDFDSKVDDSLNSREMKDDPSEQNGFTPSPVLCRFFTPHEADVRLSAVHSVDTPRRVEDGVLQWQLLSAPRLVCDAWRKAQEEERSRGTAATTQASRWQWPDVGSAAAVQVRVAHLLWFNNADEVALAAAGGKMYIAVEELKHKTLSTLEEESWMAPEDLPSAAVPRVPYTVSGSSGVHRNGGDENGSDKWSDMRSGTPSSRTPSFRGTPSAATSISAHDVRSARPVQRGSITGLENANASSPVIELRWLPRRFEWLKDDVPTAALWVLSAEMSGSNIDASKEGVREERVWGAVRLPRLEAFTANAGVLWLPLFLTYAAPSSTREVKISETPFQENNVKSRQSEKDNDYGEHDAATQPTQDASTQNDKTLRRAVAVEHVGFAAVSYVHNFVDRTLPEQPDEHQLLQKRNVYDDTALAVSMEKSRLLLVQAGPWRCRFAKSTSIWSQDEPAEQMKVAAGVEHSNAQLNHTCVEDDVPSASYNCNDFPVPFFTPGAPPFQTQLTNNPPSDSPFEGYVTEVLLGFEGYQMTVPVSKADVSYDGTTLQCEQTTLPQVVVFPWRGIHNGGEDVRTVRVQTQLLELGSRGVIAAGNTFSVRVSEESAKERNSGAQWVPLITRHNNRRKPDTFGAAGEAATLETAEGDGVLGELLVRWHLVEPLSPSSTTTTSESGEKILSEDGSQLHRLVEAYCGGPGAPCSYAILSTLATAAAATSAMRHPSLANDGGGGGITTVIVGDADGKPVKNANGVGEVAERVRKWAAHVNNTTNSTVPSRASLPALELYKVLSKIWPTSHHPCVYLLLDRIQLQCSEAHLRAWKGLASLQNNNSSGAYRFRLEVQMEWPSDWPTPWLRTSSCSARPHLEHAKSNFNTADLTSDEKTKTVVPTTPTRTSIIWIDVTEGRFSGDTTSSHETVDPTAEHMLKCVCAPLCLPLPSPRHIQQALGLPGLAARFQLSFRLFVLFPSISTVTGPTEDDADAHKERQEERDEVRGVVCLGVGGKPLSLSHIALHNMTSLLSYNVNDETNNNDNGKCTSKLAPSSDPLFLSWRAQLSKSIPLPLFSPLAAKTNKASPAVLVGRTEVYGDDEIALSVSDSALATQEFNSDPNLLFHPSVMKTSVKSNSLSRSRGYSILARLNVKSIEMSGVDLSLACGAAQRHRQTLAPATVAVMVGVGGGENGGKNHEKNTTTLGNDPWTSLNEVFTPNAALSSAILLTPSLHANDGRSIVSPNSSLFPSVALRGKCTNATLQPRQQQRYSWTTDVCARTTSQLVLYVRVVEANLRAARGEEVWNTTERDSSMEVKGGSNAAAFNTVRSELVGKAVYTLDAESWARSQQQQQQRNSKSNPPNSHEVLLDLEGLTEGRWVGRLWLEVEYLAVDTFLRDPRSTFFSTCVSIQVSNCSGLVLGDMALTRKVEETYRALRDRVKEAYEHHGRVPRKLRQNLEEARGMRRQLRKQDNKNHTKVRLLSVLENRKQHSVLTWASKPFQLSSAASLVREELAHTSHEGSWDVGSPSARDITSTPASNPLLRFTHVIDNTGNQNNREAATTATEFELRLIFHGEASSATTDGDTEANFFAAAHVRLPLREEHSPSRAASYTQHLTVPLALNTGREVVTQTANANVERKKSGEFVQPHMMITSASADTPASLAVTATWSVTPLRGDTYISCLLFETSSGCSAVDAGYRYWLLRWVYVFESSAHPEVEHAVDMPLSLRPSRNEKETQLGPSHRRRLSLLRSSKDADMNTRTFWSGATTRLPRVGSIGATIRRVELLEATPITSTALSVAPETVDDACTMIRLATHMWTVEDELHLQAKRRQAQHPGEDACLWLTFTNNAAGSRPSPQYKVLFGLYGNNSLAQYEAQSLEKRLTVVVTIDSAERARRPQREGASSDELTTPPSFSLPTHAAVNIVNSAHPITVAKPKTDIHAAEATTTEETKCSPAAEQEGGVVMKSVCFRCGDPALSPAELKKADRITCRVVRLTENGSFASNTKEITGKTPLLDKGSVVLEAGQATRVLQTPSTPAQDGAVDDTTTPKTPTAHITARWGFHTDSTQPNAATRRTPTGVSHASGVFNRPVQGLLRLDIPTRATTSSGALQPPLSITDNNQNNGSTNTSGVQDIPLCIEVCVGDVDGDDCVRYVSNSFSASSILHATASVTHDLNTPFEGSESALWGTRFPMHRVTTPAKMTEAANGHISNFAPGKDGSVSAVVETEVLWGLDVFGMQSTLAVVPCLPPPSNTHHNGEGGESGRQKKTNGVHIGTDDDSENHIGDEATVQELESYAAWRDFFATLQSQEKLRNQQAHLRHWRCRIVGVEVEGLELPVLAANPVAKNSIGSRFTTLLAQLNFSTKQLPRKRREEKGNDKTTHGVREDYVLGVARTTAVPAASPNSDVNWLANEDVDDDDAATTNRSRRQCVLPEDVEPHRRFLGRKGPTYHASFTPTAWYVALRDVIRQGCVAPQCAKQADESEDDARGAAPSPPPPGLTLWQLLTPTATTATTTTQQVYELGATQLSSMFHEGALFLVQVLTRWCSGACTQEERDALLSAAASLPTQWMPLTGTSDSTIAHGTQRSYALRGPRVRFFYRFSYAGPQCSPSSALASVMPTTVSVPTGLADAVYCVLLDHVQLVYPNLPGDASSGGHTSPIEDQLEETAVSWLSRAVLKMCVVLTTVDPTDETAVMDSHVAAQWTTRLAPLPSLPQLKLTSEVPLAAVVPLAPKPIPIPIPAPIPVSVPTAEAKSEGSRTLSLAPIPSASTEHVVTAPAQRESAASVKTTGNHEETNAGDISSQPQPPPSVAQVVTSAIPAIPTISCFCWKPSPTERDEHANTSGGKQFNTDASTVVLIYIEMELRLLSAAPHTFAREKDIHDELEDGEGEVVGHSRVYVGRAQTSALRWDRVEQRLDEGWRLTTPLSVRIPIKTPFATTSNTARIAQGSSTSGSGSVTDASATTVTTSALNTHVSIDVLAFTAPSWGLVTALQAAQQANIERRLRALATLQHIEARLASGVPCATSLPASPGSRGPSRVAPTSSIALFRHAPQMLSAVCTAHPLRVLRAPLAVYWLETFAVVDVLEQLEEEDADSRYRSMDENDTSPCGHSLWSVLQRMQVDDDDDRSMSINNRSIVCRKTWLVDALTGEVRTPQWRLLPLLTDTTPNGRTARQQSQLPSWLNAPASRLLVQERARLRLEWCRSADVYPASSLAGLIGGAAVSYTADSGDTCLWVSGGLHRPPMLSRGTVLNTQQQRLSNWQTRGGRSEAELTVPFPPRRVGTAKTLKSSWQRHRRPHLSGTLRFAGAESSMNRPAVKPRFYQLYASHFLCQRFIERGDQDVQHDAVAKPSQWKCEVDESASTQPQSACLRLFHTATKLSDNRVWLLGGWWTSNNAAVLPAAEEVLHERWPSVEVPTNTGLVERRRSEVRQAATPSATATLRWCEVVSCVQCMVDGTPAPPVEVTPDVAETEKIDATTASEQAHSPPRVACHVAAACGPHHVVLFGGLTPEVEEPSLAARATADVHIYDTVRGTWTKLSPSQDVLHWPVARYGHSCAVAPHMGGTQPSTYFVFGGATTDTITTATGNVCELMPSEELLWIWMLFMDTEGKVQSAWRRVQIPADLPSPLSGRFLPQLLALSATEVLASAVQTSSSLGAAAVTESEATWRLADEGVPIDAADVGLTSLVLCIAGGMTKTSLIMSGTTRSCSASCDDSVADDEGDGALRAFRRYVEPWLPHSATNVTAVLLASMCERQLL